MTSAGYLLDTDVCIGFLNQRDAALRKRIERTNPDHVHLCSIVKAELLYGARNSAKVNENLAKLAKFFSAFESVPFDDVAAQHYGVLRAQLRRGATPVGANDMLIAATAIAADLTLVTRNETELHHVAGLRLEVW